MGIEGRPSRRGGGNLSSRLLESGHGQTAVPGVDGAALKTNTQMSSEPTTRRGKNLSGWRKRADRDFADLAKKRSAEADGQVEEEKSLPPSGDKNSGSGGGCKLDGSHHYRIDEPDGPTSKGRCIHCGFERFYKNWLEDLDFVQDWTSKRSY